MVSRWRPRARAVSSCAAAGLIQIKFAGRASQVPAALASDCESIIAFIAGSVKRSNMLLIILVIAARRGRRVQDCISAERLCQGTLCLGVASCHCRAHVGAARLPCAARATTPTLALLQLLSTPALIGPALRLSSSVSCLGDFRHRLQGAQGSGTPNLIKTLPTPQHAQQCLHSQQGN